MQPSRSWTIACLFAPLVLAFMWIPVAQAQVYGATTETRDLIWNRSERVTDSRTQVNGRTFETQVVEAASINGRQELVSAIEIETFQESADTVRVVQRSFAADAYGRRRLSRITEVETTKLSGGQERTIRTTSDIDLNGHPQVVGRDLEESTPLDATRKRIMTTVFLRMGDGFVPVQQTEQVERRTDGVVTDIKRTIRLGTGSGKFVTVETSSSIDEGTGNGAATNNKEERLLRADPGRVIGEGALFPVQRTTTQTWQDPEGQQHSVAQTSSMSIPGLAPDGRLHLDRQLSTLRTVMPDGSTRFTQQLEQINPSAVSYGMQPAENIIEISSPGPSGEFEKQTVIEFSTGAGKMEPIWISKTRGSEHVD